MLPDNIPPYIENLKDGSSAGMSVDGSSVNKTYKISPEAGKAIAIRGLTVLLEDAGSTGFGSFGAIGALSNGLLIQTYVKGQVADVTIIKTNADLTTRFNRSHFGSSAVGTLGGAQGFGESNDAFIGYLEFPSTLILNEGDELRVVVRDDLRAIGFLQMSINGGKANA
jgi:hypothetical protein